MNESPEHQVEERRRDTVEILLAEAHNALDKEFGIIDALDRKAGTVLGAASLVVGLMTFAVGSLFEKLAEAHTNAWWMQPGLVVAGALYVAIIYCIWRALGVTTYYLPLKMEADEIRKAYLPLSGSEVREQLLSNYVHYSNVNAAIIEKKAKWVQRSLRLTCGDIAYLTLLVVASIVALRF